MLLVRLDGMVVAVNHATGALLQCQPSALAGSLLSDLCETDAVALASLLRTSARSTSPAPSSLALKLPDGNTVTYRCEGALFQPHTADETALVLLRLSRHQVAIEKFALLNHQIDLLVREVALRRAAEDKFRDTSQLLEQADRRKDEFLSMLAHELRNPLAPLQMGVQLLERKHGALPEVGRLTAMMSRQTGHLTRLVDDLLDVSRLTRGTIELREGRVSLADVVTQAVEMERPVLDARGLKLLLELADDEAILRGDLTRLVQVMANLIANAAKFTEPGGTVIVSTWSEGAEAVASVRDTGAGVAPELLPHVFDLFVQGERSLDRAQGGLGVGLTIVRSIVHMHGGSVRALSAGRDLGSEFQVRLPLLVANGSTDDDDQEQPPAAADAAPGHSLKVLIVDDNVDAAQTLCALVDSWGHEVKCAYDAREALELIPDLAPDVLLLDIGLPGMNGLDLAREIRSQPGAEVMLLVAITGYGDPEARKRSAEVGYDHHLTKPVDPDMLERMLAGGRSNPRDLSTGRNRQRSAPGSPGPAADRCRTDR